MTTTTDPMSTDKHPNRVGLMLAQGFEGFGQEIKGAFRRVVEDGGKEFDELLKMLRLTPEQESRIRQKAGDLFQKTYGKTTKGQQIQLFLDIYAELDAEQRHTLALHIGEESKARRDAAPHAPGKTDGPAMNAPMMESKP